MSDEKELSTDSVNTSTPVADDSECETEWYQAVLRVVSQRFAENENQPILLDEFIRTNLKCLEDRLWKGLLHLQAKDYIKIKQSTSLEVSKIIPGRLSEK